ncbi:MAG: TetR family transcriptional regulator [Phenylobacterium sp.]|nr:TetR family transcriptional regulator [Phenylobacterium sp.]
MGATAREARREDRRDAILDVAQECFVAEGYGATSMSTIAARLGGSKGTLYNYFRSKEELFDAVVRRSCDRLHAGMDSFPQDDDVRQRLVGMAQRFLDHLLSPEALAIYRVVVGEGERFPELARVFYEAGPRRGIARGAQDLGGLMQQGVLRQADPVLAANQFKDLALSGVYNLRLWGVIGDLTPAEKRARAEIAADTFLRAYAP